MASARAIALATVFLLLPLLLLLVVILAFDANLLAVLSLLVWMGLGLVFGASALTEA